MSIGQHAAAPVVEPPDGADYQHGAGGPSGAMLLQISNAIVRLYKDAFGRGPTKARTQFAGPDTVVIVLEDSMTVAERKLAAMGAHDRVREGRLFFQDALEQERRSIVEGVLGRKTAAYIGGIDSRSDVSVEIFMLEPSQPQSSIRPESV